MEKSSSHDKSASPLESSVDALISVEPGEVWLVGAGPGDPGLLTLRALSALRQADVVIYDALVSQKVRDWAHPQAEWIFAGKRGGKPSVSQENISHKLIDLARARKKILRLKGGDPFVFARGAEEARALTQAGVAFRLIPGLTAGLAAASASRIPLTGRDLNAAVTFVTGHSQEGRLPRNLNWKSLAQTHAVLVFYMAMKQLKPICEALLKAGRPGDEPAAIVSRASLPEERLLVSRLSSLVEDSRNAGLEPPAIVIFGANTAFAKGAELST